MDAETGWARLTRIDFDLPPKDLLSADSAAELFTALIANPRPFVQSRGV